MEGASFYAAVRIPSCAGDPGAGPHPRAGRPAARAAAPLDGACRCGGRRQLRRGPAGLCRRRPSGRGRAVPWRQPRQGRRAEDRAALLPRRLARACGLRHRRCRRAAHRCGHPARGRRAARRSRPPGAGLPAAGRGGRGLRPDALPHGGGPARRGPGPDDRRVPAGAGRRHGAAGPAALGGRAGGRRADPAPRPGAQGRPLAGAVPGRGVVCAVCRAVLVVVPRALADRLGRFFPLGPGGKMDVFYRHAVHHPRLPGRLQKLPARHRRLAGHAPAGRRLRLPRRPAAVRQRLADRGAAGAPVPLRAGGAAAAGRGVDCPADRPDSAAGLSQLLFPRQCGRPAGGVLRGAAAVRLCTGAQRRHALAGSAGLLCAGAGQGVGRRAGRSGARIWRWQALPGAGRAATCRAICGA